MLGIPRGLSGKESTCQCRRHGFDPWVGKFPWRRKWQPAPIFLPGKSHGQRSLAGYSLWGHKRVRHDLATKQQQKDPAVLSFHFSFFPVNKKYKFLLEPYIFVHSFSKYLLNTYNVSDTLLSSATSENKAEILSSWCFHSSGKITK